MNSELTINGKQYKLKYSYRSQLIYEQLAGKIFMPQTLWDMLVFCYSVLLANNDLDFDFNTFMNDYIEEDRTIMDKFAEWLGEEYKKQAELQKEQPDDKTAAKKKKKTKES